jgi:hypothetical protein
MREGRSDSTSNDSPVLVLGLGFTNLAIYHYIIILLLQAAGFVVNLILDAVIVPDDLSSPVPDYGVFSVEMGQSQLGQPVERYPLIGRPVFGLGTLSLQSGGNMDNAAAVLVLVPVMAPLPAPENHSILKSFLVRCSSSVTVYYLQSKQRQNSALQPKLADHNRQLSSCK